MRTTVLSIVSSGLLASCTGTVTAPSPVTERPLRCDDVLEPGGTALRRLTSVEIENSAADVFGGIDASGLGIGDDRVDLNHFDNDARDQVVSAVRTEQYHAAAGLVASRAIERLDEWAPCSDETAACANEITAFLGPRLFRRPLADDDRDVMLAFASDAFEEFGFHEAVAMVIEAMLQSPDFLYLLEPPGEPGEVVALDGYQVASRLSYFLWRSPPDAALMEAAADGSLDTEEGVAAQTRRMLDDERATATLVAFYAQWFQLERLDDLDLDTEIYPVYSAALGADLRASAERLFADVVRGSLDQLFLTRSMYVNDRIAPVFGVAAPGSTELVPVELDARQRAGILTHPAVLSLRSKSQVHSPIYRGTFVLDHIACAPVEAPPPGADTMTVTPTSEGPLTTRERITVTHSGNPICAACHTRIDAVGFAFEHYDALGQYRDEEFGLPVDSRTSLVGLGDADGPVDDAIDLSEAFASSHQTRACVVRHYFRYALGRQETSSDLCQIEDLTTQLEASGGDHRALVVALTTSPAFRTRLVPAL